MKTIPNLDSTRRNSGRRSFHDARRIDFNRLNLNTGQRKKIIKIQRDIQLESGDVKNEPATAKADESYEEYEFIEQEGAAGPSHIALEKVTMY